MLTRSPNPRCDISWRRLTGPPSPYKITPGLNELPQYINRLESLDEALNPAQDVRRGTQRSDKIQTPASWQQPLGHGPGNPETAPGADKLRDQICSPTHFAARTNHFVEDKCKSCNEQEPERERRRESASSTEEHFKSWELAHPQKQVGAVAEYAPHNERAEEGLFYSRCRAIMAECTLSFVVAFCDSTLQDFICWSPAWSCARMTRGGREWPK